MTRRRLTQKRIILPDPKHESVVLAKFINVIMRSGKKAVAERIVYDALDTAEKKTGEPGLACFEKALQNITPAIEVRSRRVGGATYQVPVEVSARRGQALAMRWLIGAARARNEKGMALRMAGELLDAIENRGQACKKRENAHSMAEANKAFAHYRW